MSKVSIHVPNTPSVIDIINELDGDIGFEFLDTSYREWGEPIRTDCADVAHIVADVDAINGEDIWRRFGEAGVPVNATLSDDWSSNITWGLDNDYQNWTSFFKE